MQISENGAFFLDIESWATSSILYVGDLGGANVSLTCNGVPIVEGTLASNTQMELRHGKDAPIVAVVSGLTTEIDILVCGVV